MAVIEVSTKLDEDITKLTTLCEKLDEAHDKVCRLQFVTIKEFAKISGWALGTVQELYRRKDFPSCDYGREKIAEMDAIKQYFSVPRRK